MDIVIVGDSLTAGEHASDRRRTYARLMVEGLRPRADGRPSTRVVGLPGGRVSDLLGRRLPGGRHTVVVELGTNDWSGYRSGGTWSPTSIAQFRRQYSRLLDVLAGTGLPTLVCLGVWAAPGALNGAGNAADELDATIGGEATAHGGRFVSLRNVADDPGSHGPSGRRTPFGVSDDGHPNDRGHAAIARLILEALPRSDHHPG